jgi:molybdenum cofactor synthesis domain-containing protein
MRAAVLTISTSRAGGEANDESGDRLAELARRLGADAVDREVLADDRELIESRLRHWADAERCELILTTGGTGLAPTDVTPEATAAVIDRPAPGIAEAIRRASEPHTELWMLSRGLAGARGSTLIVNLPGSPASIDETAPVLLKALPHALALLRGEGGGH